MAEYKRYGMIQDILDAEKITDDHVKDAVRLAYFRGLTHSVHKEEILDRELKQLQTSGIIK